MSARDIIVIGASAGGLRPLMTLTAALPANLRAAIFVVWHISPSFTSQLPEILRTGTALPVNHAEDHDDVRRGHIYVAPPDHHMLLEHGRVRLSHGPKENHSRPAIDPLFRSAAEEYGDRVVAVVLTGMLYDGTAGLVVVKRHGGVGIVQDPREADFDSMPRSAISGDHPDYVLPIGDIAPVLRRLAGEICHAPAR